MNRQHVISMGIALATAAIIQAPMSAQAKDKAEDMVLRTCKFGVAEALDRLTEALAVQGLKPAARFDHAAAARGAGLELRPTQVLLFGNPKVGTALMQSNQQAAIDLPMRVVAYETADGKTMVGYGAPTALITRHSLTGVDAQITGMTKALASFVAAACD